MLTWTNPVFHLDFFTIINIFALFVSIFLFYFLLKNKPYLIIKPSFILLSYVFVFFQIPLPFYSYECEKFLPNPYVLLPLVHGFVFIGLFLTSFLFVPQAQEIWANLNKKIETNNIEKNYITFLGVNFLLLILLFLIYCKYVNLNDTGLMQYIKGADIKDITLARENTLKALDDGHPKYAYSILRSCFALFIVTFGSYGLFCFWKEKKYMSSYLCLLIIFFSILISAVVLNKSFFGIMIVSTIFNLIWINVYRPSIAFLWIVYGIFSALLGSILLTAALHGNFYDVFSSVMPVINRVFVVPLKLGTWYVHYEQINGFLGVSSFPKLAHLLNVDPVRMPSLIGKIYCPIYYNHDIVSTVSANASFIFSNHLSWGIMGLPLSILMLLSLDIAIFPMKFLSRNYLIPFLSVLGTQLTSFTASGYGVCMITHGYLFSILIICCLAYRKKILYFFNILILYFQYK